MPPKAPSEKEDVDFCSCIYIYICICSYIYAYSYICTCTCTAPAPAPAPAPTPIPAPIPVPVPSPVIRIRPAPGSLSVAAPAPPTPVAPPPAGPSEEAEDRNTSMEIDPARPSGERDSPPAQTVSMAPIVTASINTPASPLVMIEIESAGSASPPLPPKKGRAKSRVASKKPKTLDPPLTSASAFTSTLKRSLHPPRFLLPVRDRRLSLRHCLHHLPHCGRNHKNQRLPPFSLT